MASLMLYIKVSVQEQQKSTKSSEVCRERKNVAEKSRRQTIKTGTSKDTDAPSIMNGNAEVIIVRFRNQSWLRDGIFRDSRSRITILGIWDRGFLFWAWSKNPENPQFRGWRSGFENPGKIPSGKSRNPWNRDFFFRDSPQIIIY